MDGATSPRGGGGTNLAHGSALLQPAAAPPAAAQQQQQQQSPSAAVVQRELLDARRKFSSSLESNVLDYLHYSPTALEECVRTLHTLFDNVLQHPGEPKYRRIKAANKTFLRCVVGVKHAEDLMLQAGWRSKVVDMEKSWVWDHTQDSHEWRVLQGAVEVLHKSLTSLHMKAEHKRKEDAERKTRHADERERIRLALEDDRRQRHTMQELTAARGPAAAVPLAAAAAADAAAGGGGGGHAEAGEGDSDDDDEEHDE